MNRGRDAAGKQAACSANGGSVAAAPPSPVPDTSCQVQQRTARMYTTK